MNLKWKHSTREYAVEYTKYNSMIQRTKNIEVANEWYGFKIKE